MEHLATLDKQAEQIVKDIGIPPCPTTLTQLLRRMRDEEPDYAKIGALIARDVGLAAAMLKTVNSAFYGLHTKAASVSQALAMLGLRTVSNLVTGLLLRQVFTVGASAIMENFWESSSNVAAISAQLAVQVGGVGRDEAYTLGLFRDCGIPLMASKFRNYGNVYSSALPDLGRPLTAIEDKQYSLNHARVGYALARSWLLHDDLCLAILWHHDHAKLQPGDGALPQSSRVMIAIGLVAEQIYVQSTTGAPCIEWNCAGALALATLNISQFQYDALLERVHAA